MNNIEKLNGLIKEKVQEAVTPINEELSLQKEANEKLMTDNKELREYFDSIQGKKFTLNQNTGSNLYTFKGYNPNMTSNFKAAIDADVREEVAGIMLKSLESVSGKANLTEANTGAYAVPVEYARGILGLAELSSVALSKARIYNMSSNSCKMPTKSTRATVDAQSFGTANTDAGVTLGQISFTLDKRIGAYQQLTNDLLEDEMFDVLGEFVEPMVAEAIGQDANNEMFNGVEFTSSVSSSTNGITTDGVGATASGITYDNLVTIKNSVELERNVNPEWFIPRGVLGDIERLTDDNGRPLFVPVPISSGAAGRLLGYNINIVPSIANAPDDGAIRLAFGDPKQYIIAIRGGMHWMVNPYILGKEAITQFIGYVRADGNVAASGAWAVLKRSDS